MAEQTETIIIGAGQAGLATSYFLSKEGHSHVLFEKSNLPGSVWSNDRWDSFTLLTPNWAFRLPGAEYQGSNPEGYMPREEVAASFQKYADRYHFPIQYQTLVTSVEKGSQEYIIRTNRGTWNARNVVVATGLYQTPKVPIFSKDISPNIIQLSSDQYRNPSSLLPGAVLVVGSAQTGCQIAEELYLSGRKVYLCIGSAGRVPRRYRGKDIYEWMYLSGFLDRTPDKLPNPQARFAGNPHVSGRDGGRTLNLHQFARDGVTLLGRLQGASDNTLWIADNIKENLAKSDKVEADITSMIDSYILQAGIQAPTEKLPQLLNGYDLPVVTKLDLKSSGITTIIWALGYNFDFSMVKLQVTDEAGYPVQDRGVTRYPGLYFVGLPWLYKMKSGHLVGVGEDAQYIASVITSNKLSIT